MNNLPITTSLIGSFSLYVELQVDVEQNWIV